MPILSNLVDAVGSQDDGAELLDALEEMVRDKRRRLEQGRRARKATRSDDGDGASSRFVLALAWFAARQCGCVSCSRLFGGVVVAARRHGQVAPRLL